MRGLACKEKLAQRMHTKIHQDRVPCALVLLTRFLIQYFMIMLRAKHLYKTFESGSNKIEILKGADILVNEKETAAIVGVSGSGKTTLLSLLAGLDTPTKGEIYLQGKPFHEMTEDERAKWRLGRVGFVFQNFELLPSLSALDNVMLPCLLAQKATPKETAKMLLQQVGLGSRLGHFPRQLSGGEQQRVAIARAFATSPEIIFADEPTGSLDTQTGENIIQLLFSLNKESGTTMIFVTHDRDLAQKCDKQYVIEDGILIAQ